MSSSLKLFVLVLPLVFALLPVPVLREHEREYGFLIQKHTAPAGDDSEPILKDPKEEPILSEDRLNMYTITLVPLGIITVVAAWITRPKADDVMSPEFKKFMWTYLLVWYVAVAADWLQGPYVYALYAAYGFSGEQIAQLFVAGFGASMIFGTFIGNMADSFGRKNCCMLYCILYIISCMTKHFNSYWILMAGRITGGIATSILFSCFESWMVSEHISRGFSKLLLKYMFTIMFFGMYVVAIIGGIVSQLLVDAFPMKQVDAASGFHMGGYNNPFDLAIISLVVCLILLMMTWTENYGASTTSTDSSSQQTSLLAALKALFTNWRIASVGIVASAFEGSMYVFVFNWTPALSSKSLPPPHGLIFAMFMMACMCGASSFSSCFPHAKAINFLVPNLGIAMCSLGAVAIALSMKSAYTLQVCFLSFLVFEFCVGVYWPSIGTLKSEVVPEAVRATMYNLYRVPLNAVVCSILLTNVPLATAFMICTCLLIMSIVTALPMIFAGTSPSTKSIGK
eukprot:gnl/MRDRNA2_/MRDRNA2_75354_c0_seq1.p1 gnl/MRDRNA2_/MRDRNA2_75354_c0~~gnl/MRDRNA2_/MRDRNA2_75354_c0_seq1.p1  ORF type:complete len:511 (-),score=49.83 gnl/MRDRNA2_/MRDRNA2_75354_c0_seq1:62-1594(-)